MGNFVQQVPSSGNPITIFGDNGAGTLVKDGWEAAQDKAQKAFDDALNFINQLEAIGSQLTNIPDISAEVGAVTHPISGFVMPDAITRPDLSTSFPSAPTEPALGNVSALNLPTAPDFVQDIPAGTMSFVEPEYTSALSIKSFLQSWISGISTGIEANVEQAIWDRARAREDVTAIRTSDTIRNNMAGRGFPVPPGAMAVALMTATQEAIDKNSSLSRDIAIKQAELEQSNRQFAINAGIQYEGQLLTYANQKAQRIFDVAAANLRGAIDLYQTTATVYGARVQGYTSLTNALISQQAAEIKVNQELPLEVFKSRIEAFDSLVKSEGARLSAISSVYETDGRVYSSEAQAEGSKASAEADIYRAEVQYVIGAANVQLETAKSTVAKMTSSIGLLTEAIKAGAQVAAQLAASSLSSVNLSGSISSGQSQGTSMSMGVSNSYNTSLNNTLSESHDYKEG